MPWKVSRESKNGLNSREGSRQGRAPKQHGHAPQDYPTRQLLLATHHQHTPPREKNTLDSGKMGERRGEPGWPPGRR